LFRRRILVCHSVSTARRTASSLASASSRVSGMRSRSDNSVARSISRSIVLLRRTSVGWAVSTGLISASAKKLCSRDRVMPAALACARA